MADDRASSGSGALDVDDLRARLAGLRLGHPLIYFPAIGSTNTYAVELARAGTAEGTLVITDDQTAGRGRVGRVWKSLPGQQLALSLALHPTFPPQFLIMASAVAVVLALEEVARTPAEIKWPNDVLISGRKVCGILIESGGDYAVLGIGLNVNGALSGDEELRTRATTVAEAAGGPISRETLAAALLSHLDRLYQRLQTGGETARAEARSEWRKRLRTLGQTVTLRQGADEVTGFAEDVNEDGALLLRLANGELRAITWGDVEAT